MDTVYNPTIHRVPRRTRAVAGQGLSSIGLGGFLATVAVILLFSGMSMLVVLLPKRPEMVLALGAGLIVALLIIRQPVAGTYLTVVLTLLFDAFPSNYVQTIFSELGVFSNLSSRGLPQAAIVSLFELVLGLALASAIVRRFHHYQAVDRGPLFWPMMALGGIVFMGEINGILSGGDLKISIWEVRALLYVVALYVLAVNTIKEPKHIRAVLWISIICIGVRSFEGIYRYFRMPGDLRAVVEVILEHDDSLFLVAPYAILLAAFLWRKWLPRQFVWAVAGVTPFATYAMLINGRRAAFLCLGLTLITCLMMVWTTLRAKEHRRLMVRLVVVAAVAAAAYLGVFWNRSGGIAEPAQSLKSVIQPDERDYASNLYRDQENENLRYTIAFSPIIGIGFGRPFAVINQMVDLTNIWSLQLYMPHNNVLWLWMRMGIVGFVVFWVTAGAAVLLVVASVRMASSRLRLLIREEQAEGPEGPGTRTAAFRGVSTEGVSRYIVSYEPHEEREGQVGHAPIAASKLNKRTRRAEMQECVEFMVLAFLGQACMVSWLAIAVADQGLMSFRLSAYVGLILGTLTSAWTMYHAKYSPALTKMIREELPEQEEKPRAKRQRMRVLTGA